MSQNLAEMAHQRCDLEDLIIFI